MGRKAGKQDLTLMILVMALMIFGLVTLRSASSWNGSVRFSDSGYFFKTQLLAAVLGFAAMIAISRMDYHIFEKYAVAAYILSLILSGLVLLVGDSYNGSKRWLSVGPLSFQPAEFAKPAVILFLARMISRSKKKKKSGFCGDEQPEHGCDYPWDRRDSCVHIQPQVSAFCGSWLRRGGLSGHLSGAGILPPGAAGRLAGPGEL